MAMVSSLSRKRFRYPNLIEMRNRYLFKFLVRLFKDDRGHSGSASEDKRASRKS